VASRRFAFQGSFFVSSSETTFVLAFPYLRSGVSSAATALRQASRDEEEEGDPTEPAYVSFSLPSLFTPQTRDCLY